MPYRYLLDTNIISELIQHPRGKTYTKIASVGAETVCTSIVVGCELKFGAVKRGSSKLSDRIETSFLKIPVLALEPEVRDHYAKIRNSLERRGLPIGSNDLLIAAHAIALDLVLVTANVREFQRIEDLSVENWLHE